MAQELAELEVDGEKYPHQVVEEEQLSLELLQHVRIGEFVILQDGEDESCVLVGNSLTRDCNHELPETGYCDTFMADEEVCQATQDLGEAAAKLSVVHLKFLEESFGHF